MQVATVVQKFAEYTKLESFNAATRKEIDEFLASANMIPKAPWDEGVCKVCGIDRDDDSVLLCDTCDAEYHTYCLNPSLASIPKGNWYCPSCAGKHIIQDASERIQVINQHKRHQGEVSRVYLEALRHISSAMEEREYWDFNVDEVCLWNPTLILLVSMSFMSFWPLAGRLLFVIYYHIFIQANLNWK